MLVIERLIITNMTYGLAYLFVILMYRLLHIPEFFKRHHPSRVAAQSLCVYILTVHQA